MKKIVTLALVLASFSPQSIAAEEANSDLDSRSTDEKSTTEKRTPKALKRITVVESEADELTTAGSAMVIDGDELERQKTGMNDIHRILRQIPGVNIQEEEGYGLRPNIGFRGVPNERNGKITVMEDSILIAPAPYSAPAAYYFPNTGKMEAVEVVKGAGQIKYGPYTTGGALNLRTREIPEELSLKAKIAAGTDDTKKMSAALGDAWKYGGILLETNQLETDGFKELDNGGETGFDVQDYNLKVRLNSDPDAKFYQEVTYKFGVYDELSNETYLGLTEDDFSANPFRRYSGSQRDRMKVDHLQHHVRHYIELSEALDLTTLVHPPILVPLLS